MCRSHHLNVKLDCTSILDPLNFFFEIRIETRGLRFYSFIEQDASNVD